MGEIQRLLEAIGKDSNDVVVLSWMNGETPWTPVPTKVGLADKVVEALADKKLNIYLNVNDVIPPGGMKRGGVHDVTKMNCLWADLDVKEGGMPSWEAAVDLIDMLSDVLNTKPAAIVNSGHGFQPYWPIEDGEVSDTNRNYMVGVARRWGQLIQRFAEVAGGKVDSVFDLARVLRAPGTVNYKGEPVATSVEVTEWSHPLTMQEVEEVLLAHGFVSEDNTVGTFQDVVSPIEDWQPAEKDCYWVENVARMIRAENPTSRHPWLIGKAVLVYCLARNACITEETFTALLQALEERFLLLLASGENSRIPAEGEVKTAYRWAQALVQTFTDVKVRDNLSYHKHEGQNAVSDLPKDLPGSQPAGQPSEPSFFVGDDAFRHTDLWNARRLANLVAGEHIFADGLGWLVWDDGVYVPDKQQLIMLRAKQSARLIAEEQSGNPDDVKWAAKSMGAGYLNAAISLAQSEPGVNVLPIQLDAKPYELCTPNGVVDLAQGTMRPAMPGVDLNTRQTAYSPRGGYPTLFMEFLSTIMEVGKSPFGTDMIEYLQLIFGMTLIGEVRWQVLPILVGGGANGKSALLEIIAQVLGSYVTTMPENFLLDTGRTEHPTELMRLRGTRLAIASESKPDGKLNETRVKMLTGEKTISARSMRQDYVDFRATHSLVVALNHPPQISHGGDSIYRRIRMVPFDYTVPEDERDGTLPERIARAEGGQILQWMIDGALAIQDPGFKDKDLKGPFPVLNRSAEYRIEEDTLASFVDEFCEVGEGLVFTATELYAQYAGWVRANGEEPMSKIALMRDLRSRYKLTEERTKTSRQWNGMRVMKTASGAQWNSMTP